MVLILQKTSLFCLRSESLFKDGITQPNKYYIYPPKPNPMKRVLHLLIAPFTIIPLFFTIVFVVNLFSFPDLWISLETMFTWVLYVVLIMIGLISYFVVHIFYTDRIRSDKKTLWTILLFFGHVVVIPVYWYMFVMNDDQAFGCMA